MGLSLGALLLAGWLMALAAGPKWYYLCAQHLNAWYGQVLLFCWSWALLYHLCNGIRHLVWDTGRGFDLKSAYASGYGVIGASIALTALVWGVVVATA